AEALDAAVLGGRVRESLAVVPRRDDVIAEGGDRDLRLATGWRVPARIVHAVVGGRGAELRLDALEMETMIQSRRRRFELGVAPGALTLGRPAPPCPELLERALPRDLSLLLGGPLATDRVSQLAGALTHLHRLAQQRIDLRPLETGGA